MNKTVEFFVTLAKIQAILSRKMDAKLNGISFNEFIILLQLSNSDDGKMRRVDLADKVGLTASGITRLLLPMEKIGLVKKQADQRDARASYISIAPGGKQKLEEAIERAELHFEDILSAAQTKQIESNLDFFAELSKIV
jgi:DNA-binding MarR family transcriptional regulator